MGDVPVRVGACDFDLKEGRLIDGNPLLREAAANGRRGPSEPLVTVRRSYRAKRSELLDPVSLRISPSPYLREQTRSAS